MLTNKRSFCFNTHNIPTSISDCHNLIAATLKGNLPSELRKIVFYRRYRNFDFELFNHDTGKINIPIWLIDLVQKEMNIKLMMHT